LSGRTRDNSLLADFQDIRDQNDVFEQVAADDGAPINLVIAGETRHSIGAQVTDTWLPTLRVQPILGRALTADDARAGNNRVVILTHAYWQRRFGSNPNVIGKTLFD